MGYEIDREEDLFWKIWPAKKRPINKHRILSQYFIGHVLFLLCRNLILSIRSKRIKFKILTLSALASELPSKNVHFKFFRFDRLLADVVEFDGPGYVGNSLSLHKIDDSNACFISPFHSFFQTLLHIELGK